MFEHPPLPNISNLIATSIQLSLFLHNKHLELRLKYTLSVYINVHLPLNLCLAVVKYSFLKLNESVS